VFIGFEATPRSYWLTITGANTAAYLQRDEFDRIYHMLLTETPTFFTAFTRFVVDQRSTPC